MNNFEPNKYPLLREVLGAKSLQPTYTVRDVAQIFGVSARAIQSRVASGQLTARDLPGRARFLSQDLEDFLVASKKKGARRGN
jgi:hypothetical protein